MHVVSLLERGSGWHAAGHFCCYFVLCGKSSQWQNSLNLHWWNIFPTWSLSLELSRQWKWSGWKLSCSLVAWSNITWNKIFHFFHGSLRKLGRDNTSGTWELMVRGQWSQLASMEQRFALNLDWWDFFPWHHFSKSCQGGKFHPILVIQKWSQKSQTKHKIAMLGKRHFIWIGEHYQCHASATVCFHHGWDHLLQSFDAESQSLWGAALPKRPKRLPWWGKRWRMVEWQCRGPRVSHLLC